MPQSQLGDILAKYQWFWAESRSKLKVKGRISECATIIARKAMNPTINSLKWEN